MPRQIPITATRRPLLRARLERPDRTSSTRDLPLYPINTPLTTANRTPAPNAHQTAQLHTPFRAKFRLTQHRESRSLPKFLLKGGVVPRSVEPARPHQPEPPTCPPSFTLSRSDRAPAPPRGHVAVSRPPQRRATPAAPRSSLHVIAGSRPIASAPSRSPHPHARPPPRPRHLPKDWSIRAPSSHCHSAIRPYPGRFTGITTYKKSFPTFITPGLFDAFISIMISLSVTAFSASARNAGLNEISRSSPS